MSLKERMYSVLLVSASETVNTAFYSFLPKATYEPVDTAVSISAAKRALLDRSYDLVIINSPLPDDPGIRLAIDICNSGNTIVLIMVRAELLDEITEKVKIHGVFVLPKPTSKSIALTALSWMQSARERLRKSEKKTLSLEERMEEIRIVNRAKWLLISELKMSEAEAHRHIEKQAMDKGATKRSIAEEIIKIYT